MITLVKAQVFKYKSIEDSSPVEIGGDVTVLVGKNESGKTAFLEALHKALPLVNAKFDFVFDYPRKDYVHYRPQHDAKSFARVVKLTFRVEKELTAKINSEVFHGVQVVQSGHTFTRTTTYGNTNSIGLDIDQTAAIAALKKPLEGIEDTNEVFTNARSLGSASKSGDATAFVIQQPTEKARDDSKTSLKDMVPLLQSLVWALFLGTVLIVWRREIGRLVQERHMKLKIAEFEVEVFPPEQVTNSLELEVVE